MTTKAQVLEENLRDQTIACIECKEEGCCTKNIAQYLIKFGLEVFLDQQKSKELPQEVQDALKNVWQINKLTQQYGSGHTGIYNLFNPEDANYLGNLS